MQTNFQSRDNIHKLDFEISDKDIMDAMTVLNMLEANSCPHCGKPVNNGWQVLLKYWAVAKDAIISQLERVGVTEEETRLAAIRAAVLKGFNMAIAVPTVIVDQAKQYLDEEKRKVNGNGTGK